MSESKRAPEPYQFLPPVPSFQLASDDVHEGETLPNAHVFDGMGLSGENLSPQLHWHGFPAETQSFAVTAFDPDAPTASGFWHWVVFNLPATCTELPRGSGSGDKSGMPAGAIHARNDIGAKEFMGAGPPEDDPSHRYIFAVHALDVADLGIDDSGSPAFVGFNMVFHTIARATLTPVYGR